MIKIKIGGGIKSFAEEDLKEAFDASDEELDRVLLGMEEKEHFFARLSKSRNPVD